MSEEIKQTEEIEPQPLSEVRDQDWFLALLVGLANSGTQFGITLQVGGFLVSGTLSGGAEYFDNFALDFARGFPSPEGAETMRTAFASGGDIYRNLKDGDEQPPTDYIHLKGARFFNTSGNPIPTEKGIWWRGRTSEVSGFVLGSLSSSSIST
jgi:hypothetical protein